MIKINLVGVAASERKARAVTALSKAKQLATLIASLVVSFAIVGLFYMIWSGSIASLNIELSKQQAEQARLAAIKQENLKYEHERALLEQRIKTIQMLQAGRVGPEEFMNALGNVVNKTTNDLFLFSVAPQGDRIVIHGQAGSATSVAALLSTQKTSGYFGDVQLRQFYEDDIQSLISYKFNLDCSYKSPSAAGSPAQAGAAAGAATPPLRPRL
jgi:Tfp pilus assembly protein PilN